MNTNVFFAIIPVLLAPAMAWIITLCIAVVTFSAGLIGIKLEARGAKKIREFIIHPKVLILISIVSTLATIYFFVKAQK